MVRLAFFAGRFPPSFVKILHVAVEERLSQLAIYRVVLRTHPHAEVGSGFHPGNSTTGAR